MVYCDFATQKVTKISFEDLQVNDKVVMCIRSSEMESFRSGGNEENKPNILPGVSALANTPKGGLKGRFLTRRRRKTVRLRHLEQKVAFMKVEQALIPHFSKLHGQPAALHTEVIRKLLP